VVARQDGGFADAETIQLPDGVAGRGAHLIGDVEQADRGVVAINHQRGHPAGKRPVHAFAQGVGKGRRAAGGRGYAADLDHRAVHQALMPRPIS
jgi:hypothetical protein